MSEIRTYQASAHDLSMLDDESVHCIVTSPPYYSLRQYAGDQAVGWPAVEYAPMPGMAPMQVPAMTCELGLEPTLEAYIGHMVLIARELWRILRSDGVFWLNIGDSYARNPKRGQKFAGGTFVGSDKVGARDGMKGSIPSSLKEKDRMLIPQRLALALQAAGFWIRQEIIWAKGLSFLDCYSGSCMPESVAGWRWERHVIEYDEPQPAPCEACGGDGEETIGMFEFECKACGGSGEILIERGPCAGCEKCDAGYVLRKGSWRPTTGHETIWMMTKSDKYYCDQEAVREATASYTRKGGTASYTANGSATHGEGSDSLHQMSSACRNPRSVWVINPAGYKAAHYAVFPEELVIPMIKAGTSEKVCVGCGAPWARMMTYEARYKQREPAYQPGNVPSKVDSSGWETPKSELSGHRPTCDCDADATVATVLDPFAGSGTVGLGARRLGRNAILVDIAGEYLEEHVPARVGLDQRMLSDGS